MTFREAIKKAISDEMYADPSVILIGEDIGRYGGCFKVTEGLIDLHPDQIIETPVSEESFTGMATGAAMMGLRPIIEIMYADFFTLVFDPIVNHAAKSHFMSGGQFSCPLVVRLPEGSGTGHGAQHTQSPEALFLNETGLKMVAPSCASDAYHLLRASIRDNNPVLFFEHKLLYSVDGGEISSEKLEIGKAKVLRRGSDLTIISYSHATRTALETAEILDAQGISSTVVDLCSLKPFDSATVLEEVARTSRAVVLQDPCSVGGVSAEICSVISTDPKVFPLLKAPVLRIGGMQSPTPFSKNLERASYPNSEGSARLIQESFKL